MTRANAGLPKIYMSRMDVEPAYLADFLRWCKCRHWPDLIAVGFHSANGYLSEFGGPRSCNVYEIPGVDVFSREYAEIREGDAELQVIVAEKISNHSLTVYEQVVTHGVPATGDDPRPSLAASWSCPAMSALRFETAAAEDERVVALHRDVVFPALDRQHELLRARLVRECAKHPVYPSPEPRWALLVEWADLSAAIDHARDASAPLEEHLGSHVTRFASNAGRQVFSLRNEVGWRP